MLLFFPLLHAENFIVTSTDEIENVMQNALPGDTLFMANGVWENAQIKFIGNGNEINPIDNILIDLSIYVGKPLSKYSFFTPNVFTTMSLVISLVGIYLIYNEIYKIGAILVFIGYFFDCLDGNFARAYNMVTHFGDLYDHISDLVKYILLIFF